MDSMKLTEMYKYFIAQYVIYCNEQWYCNLCKLKNLTDIYSHLREVHPDITSSSRHISISDSQNKSIELSDTECRELLNHGILINISKNHSTIYFCVSCKCSITCTLDHVYEHLKGRKHQTCTNNVTISDVTNEQQKLSENINGKQSIVSINVKTQTEVGSKSKIQLISEDKLRKDHSTEEAILSSSSDSEAKEEEKSIIYEKDKISNNILQIERSINMCFCSLCDVFIHKCVIEEHVQYKRHISAISALKINQQAIYIINLEEDRKIVKPLQLNSRKLDGTEYITTLKTCNYITCDQCNEKMKKNNILNHEIAVHKSNIIFSVNNNHDLNEKNINTDIPNYYPMFKCSFCNGIIHGLSLLQVHFSKCQHKENMKLLTKIKKQEYNDSKNIENFFELLEFLNLISFENNGNTIQIMEQPVMYIKNHRKSFCDLNQNFTYICIICKCNFNAIEDIIDHLCKKKIHLKHFQNILLTYKHIYSISTTQELCTNKAQAIESSICTEDILIGTLEECNINEIPVVQHIDDNSDLIAKTNTDSIADTLSQNGESNSGLLMFSDIFSEINRFITNKLILNPIEKNPYKLRTEQKKNNALDRYNRLYYKKFLDFEKIMFTCNQKKLDNIKLNLQLYDFKCGNMHCLACNVTHSYNTLYEHINCEQHVKQLTQLYVSSDKQRLKLLTELIEIESTNLRCHACNKNEKLHDKSNIKKHIYCPVHKKNRKKVLEKAMCMLEDFNTLWYNIRYFACVECNTRFQMKIEFMEHLDKNHNKLLSTKDNSKFDFCLTCVTLWYDSGINGNLVYQRHCRKETHCYLARSNDFAVISQLQSLQELLKDINGTVVNLFKLSNDILKDSRTMQLVEALIHTFKSQQFHVEVHMFGSRITGLALPNSDIDLYLDFSKFESTSVNCINTYCDKAALILQNRSKQIQKCLQTDGENWEIELILDKSRTPLIKVKHRLTGLQCDISYTNGLSVENSKLIRSFNTTYPFCRKLILFLKKWILLGNLTGSDGITNYSLTWLVIFYLQVKYKIPSIVTLIKSHNHSKIVCGWETGVGNIVPINIPELNTPIQTLLLGFFEYYEHFDYMDDVICPLLGETCRKEIFTEQISSLPCTMERYIAQLWNTANPEYFRIDSPMCVQDPFDLSHNLTKAVSILTLKRFKRYCKGSASILRNVD